MALALTAGALFAWSGGIDVVIAGADAVKEKFTGVRTLKPQCRKAQTVADTVKEVLRNLEVEMDDDPPPSWRGPLKMIKEGLAEIEKVLDVCGAKPVRAKLFSRTYVQRLRAATSQIHDAISLIGGVHAGVSMGIQRDTRDAKDELRDTLETLSSFRDKIGDEIRVALKESLGNKAHLPELIGRLEGEGLAASSQDALEQLRQLQEEADELRSLKAFAEQEIVDAVCRLSLQDIKSDEMDKAIEEQRKSASALKADTKKNDSKNDKKNNSGIAVPEEFKCPLTLDLMEDPVLLFTDSGGTFERRALEEYLQSNPTRDPLTGLEHGTPLQFAPNRSLKDAIAKWYEGEVHKLRRRDSSDENGETAITPVDSDVLAAKTPATTTKSSRDAVGGPPLVEEEKMNESSAETADVVTDATENDPADAAEETDDVDDALAAVTRALGAGWEPAAPAAEDNSEKSDDQVETEPAVPAADSLTKVDGHDSAQQDGKMDELSNDQKATTSFDLKKSAALALARRERLKGTPEKSRSSTWSGSSDEKVAKEATRSASGDTTRERPSDESTAKEAVRSASAEVASKKPIVAEVTSKKTVRSASSDLVHEKGKDGKRLPPAPPPSPPEGGPRLLVASTVEKKKTVDKKSTPLSKRKELAAKKMAEDVRSLVRRLAVVGSSEQESAGADLLELVKHDTFAVREEISRCRGIEVLCAVVEKGVNDAAKTFAAKILLLCSMNHDETKSAIALAGGIYPLVQLVKHGVTDASRGAAAGALANLARIDDNQIAITTSGGIANLVGLVDAASPSSEAAAMAAAALRNLCTHGSWNQAEVVRCGGVTPLCEKLDHGGTSTRESCAAILKRLTGLPNTQVRVEIAKKLGVSTFFGGAPSKAKLDACIDKRKAAPPPSTATKKSSPRK